VKLSYRFGHLIATPINGNGSGDWASLVNADAFIQLPNDKVEFKKGDNYPIIRYR
jgi:molybdopterin molybdotransferase